MKKILYILMILCLSVSCSESYNMEEEIIPVEKLMDNKYIDMVANNTYKHELSENVLVFDSKDNIQFIVKNNIYNVKIDTYIITPEEIYKLPIFIAGKTGAIYGDGPSLSSVTFYIINSDSIKGNAQGILGYWIKQ